MKKRKSFIYLIFLLAILLSLVFLLTNQNILIKIYGKLDGGTQAIILSILSNKKTTLKIENDLNTKFLPETQQQNLNFKKIKIKDLKENEIGYGPKSNKKKSFFIEIYENNIFLIDLNGTILFSKLDNFERLNENLKKIKNNLQNVKIKDFLFHNSFIYISAVQFENKCRKIKIYKSKINYKILDFKEIFSSKNCNKDHSVQAGRITIIDRDKKKFLLLSTNTDETIYANNKNYISLAQNLKSIFGKTIIIDLDNHNYKIFSWGHRNILGLYFDHKTNLILSTENGPQGGDEINKIEINKNYGWNISSYGESYSRLRNDKPNYKKSHSEFNFQEPIISFIPAIAPTQIIRIDDNFSLMWKDNFIMGSLIAKSLYRIKFDNELNRVLFIERIYIGERIRDLIFSRELNAILIAMEDSGSIGIIKKF